MVTIINMIAFVVAVVALFLFLHYLCAAKGAPFCSVSRCFPPPGSLSLSLSLSLLTKWSRQFADPECS